MVSGSTVTFSEFFERSSKTSLYLQKKRELNSSPSLNSHKLSFMAYLKEKVSTRTHPTQVIKIWLWKRSGETNQLQTLKLLFPCSLLKGRVHSRLGVQALGAPLAWNMYTQTSVWLVSSPPNICPNVWVNLP